MHLQAVLKTDSDNVKEVLPIENRVVPVDKSYDEMTVEELQAAIYQRMKQNGPVTDQMKRDIEENVYHNSLVNWIKSFR